MPEHFILGLLPRSEILDRFKFIWTTLHNGWRMWMKIMKIIGVACINLTKDPKSSMPLTYPSKSWNFAMRSQLFGVDYGFFLTIKLIWGHWLFKLKVDLIALLTNNSNFYNPINASICPFSRWQATLCFILSWDIPSLFMNIKYKSCSIPFFVVTPYINLSILILWHLWNTFAATNLLLIHKAYLFLQLSHKKKKKPLTQKHITIVQHSRNPSPF